MSTRTSPSLWERGRIIRCEIFASDHADENAVGVRDHEERDALVTHPLRDRVASRARSDGARPERHRVFGTYALACAQRLPADETQDDAVIVGDDADLPPVSNAFCDSGDELAGQTPGRVRMRDASDARAAVGLPFERQSERAPVGLPPT
jgi:hypothetical protein